MAKPTMNHRTNHGSQTVQDLASAMQGVTIPDRMESVDMRDAAGAAAASSAPAALSSSSLLTSSGAVSEPASASRPAALLFHHPDTAASTTAGTLRVPVETERRPLDDLGPPADPLDYPKPRIERGRRADVLCYFPSSDRHQVVKNVLFRDFSRGGGGGGGGGGAGMSDAASSQNNNNSDDACDNRVKQAYWPVPHKRPIKTIMGHVEICIVLERCTSSSSRREDGDDDDEDLGSTRSNSSSSAYDDEEDDDIVFQLTDKRVAVKVNYAEKMERLRNRHAEDPLKEIAAMQLIGDVHPHVLGCRDVLYDATSKTLNVVMRFCESGDLFELLQQQQNQHQNPDASTMGMTEGRARFWFRQFVEGIDYLHSVGICHRDLSPENVMIDSSNRCLIIDMGMALRVPYLDAGATTSPAHQPGAAPNVTDVSRGGRPCLLRPQGACGKLPYMSPEIYRNRDPFSSEAVDLFTAGTILFCMLTGNRSYQTPQSSDPQFYWMTHGLEHLLADWNITLSPEGLHLLKNLLQINPRLRLTLHEVKHHPWFRFPDEPPPPALPKR